MINDMRGRIAELLAKAIDRTRSTRQCRRARWRRCASSSPSMRDARRQWRLSRRRAASGYAVERRRLQRRRRCRCRRWRSPSSMPRGAVALPYLFEEILDMQAPMLQPVGGMDRIAHAIYEQVRPAVRLNSPITAIRRIGDGVRIEHGPGRRRSKPIIASAPCRCHAGAHPERFLAGQEGGDPRVPYLPSVKVAFESPRFWERGRDLRRHRLDRPAPTRTCSIRRMISTPPEACWSALIARAGPARPSADASPR